MLNIQEIALVLKPGLENGRISLADAERMLLATDAFDLEEYGFDTLADFLPSLCEDFELDDDVVIVSGKTLEGLMNEEKAPEQEPEQDSAANIIEKKPATTVPVPTVPPEGFDVEGMNKALAAIIVASNNEFVPLTYLGQGVRQKGIVIPANTKLRACLGWSPDIFVQELRGVGNYYIGLTPKGKEMAKKAPAPGAGPGVPPAPPTSPATPIKQVSVSRYALPSFCVIAPVNDFLAQLAKIAEPDGWFIIDDPAEKQPYRLLLRKLELDFALAMRDELEGRESPFRTGMIRGTYRTNFHDASGKPIYMEMEFNSQRDASTMAPWKFKRFYVEG